MNEENTGEQKIKRLDFLDTSSDNVTEDMILEYLGQIIADIYLKEMEKDDMV